MLREPIRRTQSAIDYMDALAASIAGSPLNSWAGPINMALSGEWRGQAYELTNNPLPVSDDPLNCTGIRLNNCVAGTTANGPAPPPIDLKSAGL